MSHKTTAGAIIVVFALLIIASLAAIFWSHESTGLRAFPLLNQIGAASQPLPQPPSQPLSQHPYQHQSQQPSPHPLHSLMLSESNKPAMPAETVSRAPISRAPIITAPIQEQIEKNPQKVISVVVNTKDKEKIRLKSIGKIKDESKESLLVEIPAEKISELVEDSGETLVEENKPYYLMLSESAPLINAPIVWNAGYSGEGVKIAIIDTGIDINHEAFPPGKILAYQDFTASLSEGGSGGGTSNLSDIDGHGTHVAGIAAGNSTAIQGIAPGAKLLIAKVFWKLPDGNITSNSMSIKRAVEWATDMGADVISMSLGSQPPPEYGLQSSIQRAKDAGILVVAAAGNCGLPPCNSCGGYVGVMDPASFPTVIAVGATSKQDELACFSSQGPINGLIKPDVSAPGVSINAPWPGGEYKRLSGTSMAAPHIAGALAVLKQRNPNLDFDSAMLALSYTSKDLGLPGKDSQFGFGRIDIKEFGTINVTSLTPVEIFFEPQLSTGVPQHIEIHLAEPKVVQIHGSITPPLGGINQTPTPISTQLSFQQINPLVYASDFNDTLNPGRYSINVSLLFGGIEIPIDRRFEVAQSSSSIITSISMPTTAGISQGFEAEAILDSLSPINATVEVHLFKVNNPQKIEAAVSKRVAVSGPTTARLRLQANLSPEHYTAQIIASFGSSSSVVLKNITLIDDILPALAFEPDTFTIQQGMPATLGFTILDHSPLTGNATVKGPGTGNDARQYIAPLYGRLNGQLENAASVLGSFLDTQSPGTYHYQATVCDKQGNCISLGPYNFMVEPCEKKSLVVITNEPPTSLIKNLKEGYCIGELKRASVTELPQGYLSIFGGVIWDAGRSATNIEPQDFESLSTMFHHNQTVIIIGSGITKRYKESQILERILHLRQYAQYFILSANSPEERIVTTRIHPLITHLAPSFVINASREPSPTSMTPLEGAEMLAKFADGGAAIIAYENTPTSLPYLSRIAIVSFSLDSLNSTLQQEFSQDLASWVLEKPAEDFVITNYTTDRFPVDGEPFNLQFATNTQESGQELGQESGQEPGARVELHIPVYNMVQAPVHAGRAMVPLTLSGNPTSAETRSFTADLITPQSERNYLNNRLTGTISVAPKLPDLTINLKSADWDKDTINVTVIISNNGGTAAVAQTRISLEEAIFEKTVSLEPGMTALQSVTAVLSPNLSQNSSGRRKALIHLEVDPLARILESNETNNHFNTTLYSCLKDSVVVVDDSMGAGYGVDDHVVENHVVGNHVVYGSADETGSHPIAPSLTSASLIKTALQRANYCVTALTSSTVHANPALLDNYSAVVWSTGNATNHTLSKDLLKRPMLLEGEHIASSNPSVIALTGIMFETSRLTANETPLIASYPGLWSKYATIMAPRSFLDRLYGQSIATYNGSGTAVAISQPLKEQFGDQDDGSDDGSGDQLSNSSNSTKSNSADQKKDNQENQSIGNMFGLRFAAMGFSAATIVEEEPRDELLQHLVSFLIGNHPPTATIEIPDRVFEGALVEIGVHATDKDGDNVTVSINDSRFLTNGSRFIWQTGFQDAGTRFIEVMVSDQQSAVRLVVNVTVANTNRAPIIHTQDTIHSKEGTSVVIYLNATDEDQDNLSFIFNDTRFHLIGDTLIWNTTFTDAGTYHLMVSVSDGDLNATSHITIHIENVNRPPLLLANQTFFAIHSGESVTILFTAEDPDKENLTLSTSSPSALITQGSIIWRPIYDNPSVDNGTRGPDGSETHILTLIADDGKDRTTISFTVKVVKPQNKPLTNLELPIILPRNAVQGETISLSLNTSLQYTAAGPRGIILDGNNITWTLDKKNLGTQTITINATDGRSFGNTSFLVTVFPNPKGSLDPRISNIIATPATRYLRLPKFSEISRAVWIIARGQDKNYVQYNFSGANPGIAQPGTTILLFEIPKRARIIQTTFSIILDRATGRLRKILTTFFWQSQTTPSLGIDISANPIIRIQKNSTVEAARFTIDGHWNCNDYATLSCPGSPTCPPWYFKTSCTNNTRTINSTHLEYEPNGYHIKLPKLARIAGSFFKITKGETP